MRQKYPIILLCLLLVFPSLVRASHIVGGEISLEKVSDFRYLLGLHLYYDQINIVGNFNIEQDEVQVLVRIFSKSNDSLITSRSLAINRDKVRSVNYFRPVCIDRSVEVRTRLLVYEGLLTLDPNIYNDPEGYYVIWQRCCRNSIIDNIELSGNVGMVFYLEFPPVQIANSSPVFSIPQGTFFCLNESNVFNFGAFDPDGDSLAYSFVDPLIGHSSPEEPGGITRGGGAATPPIPAPYPIVNWINDELIRFDANTAVPSDTTNPDARFRIDQTGQISVTPNLQGLFVFSIRCEEFRNGVKIGEVRRDFQLYALDCPNNEPPQISLQTAGSESNPVLYQTGEILEFDTESDQLCFDLWFSDPDPNELLNIQLVSRTRLPSNILSANRVVVPGPGDSVKVQLCWPRCAFSSLDSEGNLIPVEFDIVAFDDRCPEIGSDTLRVNSVAVPISNNPPAVEVVSDLIQELTVGDGLSFDVLGRDIDNDNLQISAQGQGFDLEQLGMLFPSATGTGNVQSLFEWQTNCELFLALEQESFFVDFIVSDLDLCGNSLTDTITVELSIKDQEVILDDFLPPNTFTPNEDGINDHFFIEDLPEENCRIQYKGITIYNRWGGEVYDSNKKDFSWDGGHLPGGVYFYRINFTGIIYRGTINLVR